MFVFLSAWFSLAQLGSACFILGTNKKISHIAKLCRYQFVDHPWFGDRLWRVTEGTGMGYPASGEISDAALYVLAERALSARAWKYNIRWICRYRDDIIISYRDTFKFLWTVTTILISKDVFFTYILRAR